MNQQRDGWILQNWISWFYVIYLFLLRKRLYSSTQWSIAHGFLKKNGCRSDPPRLLGVKPWFLQRSAYFLGHLLEPKCCRARLAGHGRTGETEPEPFEDVGTGKLGGWWSRRLGSRLGYEWWVYIVCHRLSSMTLLTSLSKSFSSFHSFPVSRAPTFPPFELEKRLVSGVWIQVIIETLPLASSARTDVPWASLTWDYILPSFLLGISHFMLHFLCTTREKPQNNPRCSHKAPTSKNLYYHSHRTSSYWLKPL